MTVSVLVEPAYHSHPRYTRTLGPEVADLAAIAGFAPDPEQELLLDDLFALRPDGNVAAFEFAVICCRQNLKTALFKQAALGWLFVADQRLVVWSAHEFRTAQEAFRDMSELVEGSPALSRRVKNIYRGNGDEAIELRSGARLIFKARTKGGGRGLSGDKVVLDEAFALQPSHMGALLPTLSARPDPQVVYGSSAGLAESEVLRGVRDRGRAGVDPSLAYAEWCAPDGTCPEGCDHGLDAERCAMDDRENWQLANPAMGRRITVDYIAAERRALPPLEFGRERLGWWDDPALDNAAIDPGKWADVADSESRPVSLAGFAVEVSLDRAWSAIGVAGPRSDGLTHVECVDHRRGTGWVVDRCVELDRRWGPATFVIDQGGPAASLQTDMEAAGLSVHTAATKDVTQGCSMLLDAIAGKDVRHLGDVVLDEAVAAAKKRPLGDGAFAFGRKASMVDISPLQAVTLAFYLAQTEAPLDDVTVDFI